MRSSVPGLRVGMIFVMAAVLLGAAARNNAWAENTTPYVFSQEALDKTLGALSDLRNNKLPLEIGSGDLDTEIANLQKQPKIADIIKKRGLSPREFVLTYKAATQIREAEKPRDHWQKIMQDPDADPQAKLDATQKLADSLKKNLFTPVQIELVRRKMPDLETLLTPLISMPSK